jgi:hypothetical protein
MDTNDTAHLHRYDDPWGWTRLTLRRGNGDAIVETVVPTRDVDDSVLGLMIASTTDPTHHYLTHSVGTGEDTAPLPPPEEIGALIDALVNRATRYGVTQGNCDVAVARAALEAVFPLSALVDIGEPRKGTT